MERKELEAKVIELIAAAYNKDAAAITTATSFADDLKGASVQMVGLASELENELLGWEPRCAMVSYSTLDSG